MRLSQILPALGLSIIAPCLASGPLEIRFNTAATDWESQALPIGNGRMGAMIYGDPLAERMQFNEISLWTGGANLSGNYDITTFGAFQNFGDLYLEASGGTTVTWPSLATHAAASSGEGVDRSVDGLAGTKWCFEHKNQTVIWQTEYQDPTTFTSYSLTSANDVAARDPKSWTLQGSTDGSAWIQLDSRTLDGTTTPVWPFPSRGLKVTFTPAATGSYRFYRFVFAPNTAVPHFQVAEITLTGSAPPPLPPTNLVRTLDVANATHRVTWTRDGTNFTRESIASRPHQVIATRFTASQPGKITTRIRLAGAHGETPTVSGNEVGFAAALGNNLRYATRVRVLNTGGTVTAVGNTLLAQNCDSLVILHAAATDYAMDATTTPAFRNGIAPATPVAARLEAAATAGYDAIKTAHLADFRSLFNRVTLDLGIAPPNSFTPTRLNAYKTGGVDRHLEELLFQYGRYLMISSSRDSLPANLQGLWNNSNTPAWNSDYHVNINLQMNYWMNGPANLAECQQPLFNYLGAIRPLSIAATKASFGATTPGWTMRTSTNPFGGHGWQWDTPSSAWLARHYWEHYAFTGDTTFLQNTAWPVMKEICQYWIAQLIDNGSGKLVAPNGWSPEHGPHEDGVSYQQEIVWDLLSNTISAADVLGNDPVFRAQLVEVKSRLLVPAIGPLGQITEWANPATEAAEGYGQSGGHRHTSHLYAVYPGYQFNTLETPQYVTAAKLSLTDRGTSGDSRRSWTWPWRTALWARMGEPGKAYDMVRGLLTYNTMSNLYTTHTPFQIDGNLGFPGAVCEMLVQSQSGEIAILPALPAAWASGSFTGIRARGGFEIDTAWQNGAPVSLAVRSDLGKQAVVRLPATVTSPGAFVRGGGSTRAVTKRQGTLVFPTVAGGAYTLDTNLSTTADADGDGSSTYQEWLAGTDPDKGSSRLAVTLVKDGADWKAQWPELAGRKYVLQFSAEMLEWDDVETRLPVVDGQAAVPVAAGTKGFYRVVVSLE